LLEKFVRLQRDIFCISGAIYLQETRNMYVLLQSFVLCKNIC
jgi:hypothetical protein